MIKLEDLKIVNLGQAEKDTKISIPVGQHVGKICVDFFPFFHWMLFNYKNQKEGGAVASLGNLSTDDGDARDDA